MARAPQRIHINTTGMLDIVGTGVRRASSFMALGLRVSRDETVNSVTLDANFQMHFMPVELPVEQVREVQRNFRPWIIGNGLRELDQATSIFADNVYESCSLVEFDGRAVTREALDRIKRFKDRTNVANKLQVIADTFGIDTGCRIHMPGLCKARNALSHNMGIVGDRHCTHDRELQLSWIGFELAVGDRVIAGNFEPLRVEAGELIQARTVIRRRSIPVNSPIELTEHELHEICLTYWVQAQKIIEQLRRQLCEMGIGPIAGQVGNQ